MREVVFGMMTTLNGRLDDPGAWVAGVPDDLYRELDRAYDEFDAILVGQTTYDEMYEYWPGAETDEAASEISRSMARKMNTYRKYVFSGADEPRDLEWSNSEQVLVHGDDDIVSFVNELKAQSGKHIHLAGGAELAQTIVRLELVDEFHFYVYPVVLPGASWFAGIDDQRRMELMECRAFENGVAGLYYRPQDPIASAEHDARIGHVSEIGSRRASKA